MPQAYKLSWMLGAAIAVTAALGPAIAQQPDPNTAPDPYKPVAPWGQLPNGRSWGQVISVKVDRDGKNIWVFDRCGNRYCDTSPLDPIVELDAAGKYVRSFGAGLFVFPHGLYVDRDDNIWATDGDGRGGKGQQVFKFSPEGKVLMTLGKAGIAGDGPDTFNKPTDVVVAANGDIFVADGHGNSRIVKFSPDGKFIKAWGSKGSGPGQFQTPHSLAMDSSGRIFVADRGNSRIQIFDQDGKFLADWRQFGRPSGLYIDKNDILYATDAQSNPKTNPGFKRGIRIGSVKDGKVTAFIPDPVVNPPQGEGVGEGTGPEGITADARGTLYGGETTEKNLTIYVKK